MNNAQKNSYVRKQITNALIGLMGEKEFKDISVSELTRTAQVGRISFYRNYTEREDVLRQHIKALLQKWQESFDRSGCNDINEMWGSLFGHFAENRDFLPVVLPPGIVPAASGQCKGDLRPQKKNKAIWIFCRIYVSWAVRLDRRVVCQGDGGVSGNNDGTFENGLGSLQ